MRVSTIVIVLAIVGGGVYYAYNKGYIGQGKQAVAQSFDMHYNKGYALFTKGDYTAAIPELEKAYELEPRNDMAPACLRTLGTCHKELKEYAKAIEYYNKVLAEFPDFKQRGQVEQEIEKTKAFGNF